MRRLQRVITASHSWRGQCSLRRTHGFLCYRQGDLSERASRCRHQRRLARADGRPLRSAIRSRPPHPEHQGHNVPAPQETQAGCAAAVDVDVTVTCSSFTSELQRLFPWSTAYSVWQRHRRRRTSTSSARSALPSTAALGEDWVSSEPPTAGEGYDWRRLFIVRYEPHPARPSATPTTPTNVAERGCGDSTAAAAIRAARHDCRESWRRSRASQQSQAGIRETPLNTTAAMAAESTCEGRAAQLWREVLLSPSSRREGASCPLHESQVAGSSHAALRGAAHTTVAGRRGRQARGRTAAGGITDSPTTRRAGGGVRAKRASVPSTTLSEAPLLPLYAWTTPPTYELYHLCEDLDRWKSSAASPAHVYPAQVTQGAGTPLEHRRRRSDIVRRLRRVGRLHAIPGLPQLPPLLLSRDRAMSSAEVHDGAVGCPKRSRQRGQRLSPADAGKTDTLQVVSRADKAYSMLDDGDMSVEQEDVLVGTVCSLHDYCHYLTGCGGLEDGEAADIADEAAHLSPSHKGQVTTDSPASSGRSAHVPETASDRVSGAAGVSHCVPADAAAAASSPPSFPPPKINAPASANMFRFTPPLSRGAETTGRGMCSTSLSKRWQVLGDDDGGKAVLPGSDAQQRVRSKRGTATAGIRPHRLYEDVGHQYWSRIASNAFLEEKVRICRCSHEPSRTTAAFSSAHPPAPPPRVHVAAPMPRRQEQAAHRRRERAAPTTDAGVLPLSSTSCAALSPAASDALGVGCTAAALSASHSVGVLLAHEHEWTYFSVLFHTHAAQFPRRSAESAAARLASHRSLDLSYVYCFLDPPCRLYTEELEEWAHAARERRREREWVRDGRHIRHGPPPSPSSAHGAPARTHPTASRLGRGAEASGRGTLVASEPLSPSAAPMASPHTWLVYVHPDVALQTLPRLWACAFGEDASNNSGGGGGSGQAAFECGTTRVLDGRHEVDGDCKEWVGVNGGDVGLPSCFYAAVSQKRRRQAAEVEMVCRYLLPTTPPPRNASSALLVHPAEVPVRARARSCGRPTAAASTKTSPATTSSTSSTAAVLRSDAVPQRLPTSATGLPPEDDGHGQQQQRQELACSLLVSPLPRCTDLIKQRRWLGKPFVLAEELKYGRVVKYSHAQQAAPRVV